MAASLEALNKRIGEREAQLMQSEQALAHRQAQLSETAGAAQQEAAVLRADHEQARTPHGRVTRI